MGLINQPALPIGGDIGFNLTAGPPLISLIPALVLISPSLPLPPSLSYTPTVKFLFDTLIPISCSANSYPSVLLLCLTYLSSIAQIYSPSLNPIPTVKFLFDPLIPLSSANSYPLNLLYLVSLPSCLIF
jgi:hypothetical protein